MKIGVLLFPGVQPIDAIGPWEVFGIWKKVLNPDIQLILVSEKDSYIECDNDVILKAHANFSNVGSLDYLIVPGGMGRLTQVNNTPLINFIKKQALTCKIIASVCTGAFLLQKAGLLAHRQATTYWMAIPELKQFSDIAISEQRIVKDKNIWTAGGVTSGIDLALDMIKEIAGVNTSDKVRLLLEYFPTNIDTCNLENANQLPMYIDKHRTTKDIPKYIWDLCGKVDKIKP